MKKKLILFITGMMVTATLLMGCSGNTSDHRDDSMGKEDIAENTDTSTSDSEEIVNDENAADDKNSEEDIDEGILEEDTNANNDSSETDPYAKIEKGDYPRLVQYLECKTYTQFLTLLNEDSVDGCPVLTYQDINGSYELNAYLSYEEYSTLIIDDVVYESIVVEYNMSTDELLHFAVRSEITSVEKCIEFEKFALDYYGDDYTIPETNVGGELGEAMENAILYKYSWSMDGDITAVVIATNYEGTHQFTVGWNGPEY